MKWLGVTAACTLFLVSISCKNSALAPAQQGVTDPLNRVDNAPPAPPSNFVHKTFQLGRVAQFEFEVPAHRPSPRLEGTFQAFVMNQDKEMTSNDDANVDVLLLDEEELDDFLHDRPGTPKYQVSASHGQTIDYALPSTFERPQNYYLVFRSPQSKGLSRWIKADFTAYF